jgi:hypothetical protein
MVCTFEVHNLKRDWPFMIIIHITKFHVEIDATQGFSLLPRHYTVEGGAASMLKLGFR